MGLKATDSEPYFFITGIATGMTPANSQLFRVMQLISSVVIAMNFSDRLRREDISKDTALTATNLSLAEAGQVISGNFAGAGALMLCKSWVSRSFITAASGISLMLVGCLLNAKMRQVTKLHKNPEKRSLESF